MEPQVPRVLIAIPAFNEAEKLPSLLDQFPKQDHHNLLVIDDGSTDGTADLLSERGVEFLRHPENRGVGLSIREAIAYGRERQFELIVVMAGNGKMLPAEIPVLLQPLLDGRADYVQGSRNLPGGQSPYLPATRKFAIAALTAVTNVLLGFKGTDATCGFRAYRLSLFDDTEIDIDQPWLDKYELEYYIHYKVIKRRYRVVEVPVSMIYPASRRNYSKIRPFAGWWSILRPWVYLTLGLRK